MKWVFWIVVSLVGSVGIVALIGAFLPVGHVASRTADFNKPPADVFALIANPATYRAWWTGADVKSEVVESAPPSRLVTRVIGETQFGGTWTIDILPTSRGSSMTVTERGEIYNVVFRTLARYVFGYTGTMDSFLAAAKLKLNEN